MQMEQKSRTKGFFRLNDSWCVSFPETPLTVFASNSMELEFPVIDRTDCPVVVLVLSGRDRVSISRFDSSFFVEEAMVILCTDVAIK